MTQPDHDPGCTCGPYAPCPIHDDAATQSPADSEGSAEPITLLADALEAIRDLQPKALGYIESNDFVFDKLGPLADDATDLDRWKVLAFTLYTDLAKASFDADAALAAAAPPAGGLDVERLAALEHQQWIEWASTLLSSEPGISKERRTRWQRLIATPYDQLTEAEKHQDRVYAEKVARLASRDQEEEE